MTDPPSSIPIVDREAALHDETFMARALRLAALGRHASPNPMVGCVLTDIHGVKVSEGYHVAPGMRHAEADALYKLPSGIAPHTAYVTLEPCSHYGRTPPCADALIRAGVRQVFVAMEDPDARVSGQGIRRLRDASVVVHVGLLESRARELNAAYIKHRVAGLPYVTLKMAVTLDGKIATASGDSRWISSKTSRLSVHRQLRDRCDAILTGVGTVLADDPALNTRLRHGRNPLRVIVDSELRTPESARVVQMAREDGKTLFATTKRASTKTQETFQSLGCQIIICKEDDAGRVSLSDLLASLGTRGDIVGVLVEAGAGIGGALIGDKLVDRLAWYIAPKIVGSTNAPGPIGGPGVSLMADASQWHIQNVRRCGIDIVIDARWVECS